ncbi:hypothetical protein [Coleofasciculus sp.]|uniref:hypothetical protein n=1 Tax=Coleofasciculus sp. TaxID=3100458 RepID=UPI003A165077
MIKTTHVLVLLSVVVGIGASLGLTGASQFPQTSQQNSPLDKSKDVQPEQQSMITQSLNPSIPANQLAEIEQMVEIPSGFILTTSQSVTMDGEAVWHLRYERDDQQNQGLYGEHLSVVVSQDSNRLKGITWMDAKLSHGDLPNQESAQKAAIAYLQDNAPDLLNSMDVQWIKPHDEQIQIRQETGEAQTVTITGMKVKCYNPADGSYFWVIVGPQEQIITFERDIIWSTNLGRRQTEKWLHDQWVAQQQTIPR